MALEVMPYQSSNAPAIPRPGTVQPGVVQGIFFTLPPESVEPFIAKLAGWFEGRLEVAYVDHGITDKQGDGYIILEWSDFEPDPLLQAQLRDEENIIDYTVYTRYNGQEG